MFCLFLNKKNTISIDFHFIDSTGRAVVLARADLTPGTKCTYIALYITYRYTKNSSHYIYIVNMHSAVYCYHRNTCNCPYVIAFALISLSSPESSTSLAVEKEGRGVLKARAAQIESRAVET